ncbi:DegV family protein [Zhihengliuella salsuginis]|uniref:DegV domain-containing protein n=1 Tax=Zhihengliuella salsuginis TaxID=578222 RepID=A0ABQ3GCY5_9MICC|nr:DegV family protein [Zhihengliuella salsuginis]GHD02061.1 DegV domain-containing protein [Zhihengliuella salsuginis]
MGNARGRQPAGWIERLRGLASSEPRQAGGAETADRVAVVTDSAAALPEDWLEPFGAGVRVVPMPVMIDGQIYTEGHDDVETALATGLATGARISTSRPAPGVFARTYGDLAETGYTAVVSVHLSSGLSGTVDAARLAARDAAIDVRVVDSETVGMAQGYAVLAALEAARGGGSADDVAAAAAADGPGSINFVVPTLDQLRRGGRITLAASVLGTLLSVKPLLTVRDGQIQVRDKVRTQSRALDRLVEISRDAATARAEKSGRPARIAVHCYGNTDQAQEIVHELAAYADGEVRVVGLPAVLGAHTGAGVVAVVVA